MTSSQLKISLISGSIVFIIIFLVGLASEVSVAPSLQRGAIGGLAFAVIVFSLINIVKLLAFNKPNNDQSSTQESKFDFRIDDDGAKPSQTSNFEPLEPKKIDPKQIDPEVNKIINEDPERMAELVRKMGLDE